MDCEELPHLKQMANLTVNIDPVLLKKAKIYATKNDTTLSELVRKRLIEIAATEDSVAAKCSAGKVMLREGAEMANMGLNEFISEVATTKNGLYHIPYAEAEVAAKIILNVIQQSPAP